MIEVPLFRNKFRVNDALHFRCLGGVKRSVDERGRVLVAGALALRSTP